MERLRQRLFPGILIGLLLLANLVSMNEKPAVTPTPAPQGDQGATVAYPDLPGRLIFRSGNELQQLADRKLRSIALPTPFALPGDARTAFAPNGNWVAGFTRQGDQSFLDAVDLASGAVTRLGSSEPGEMLWSPDSQQLAVWAGSRLEIFGFNRGNRLVQGGDGVRLTQAVWAPDGKRLAMEVTPPSAETSTIEVLDLSSPTGFERITQPTSHPFWAPNGEGLIFGRYVQEGSLATELVLRKPDGHEVILARVADLLQANPEVADIQGAIPHLTSIQGGYNPAEILFTLKFYSDVNPRFAIGSVNLPGTPVHLHLLPVFPDHPQNQNQTPPRPCYPGALYRSEASLLFVAHGFGCEGLVGRLEYSSLVPLKDVWTAPIGLVAPDGDYVLNQPAPGAMPTVTGLLSGGSTKMIPLYGEPIHWDRG
ncbi:MAG TPA: hypothetical protein VK191_04670 [Symbiobacteriaceae bacterium]|nr:hypothetical protein [Symbiobacteriaceae bacterium]